MVAKRPGSDPSHLGATPNVATHMPSEQGPSFLTFFTWGSISLSKHQVMLWAYCGPRMVLSI